MADLAGIKNIIFDYGGVIINIDFKITIDAFKKLGFSTIEEVIFNRGSTKLLTQMEKGTIEPDEFYNEIRRVSNLPLTDKEIKNAWNALLLNMPEKRIQLLKKLKNKYRIFLLSNSNIIHFQCYSEELKKIHHTSFNRLFDKAWFSFDLNMTKPHLGIFKYVIADAKIKPNETLFIDDSEINVEAARKVGMKGYTLLKWEEITDILK